MSDDRRTVVDNIKPVINVTMDDPVKEENEIAYYDGDVTVTMEITEANFYAENVADEDIYLDEFRDEIDGWVIDAIKAIGIDTAKAVLNAPREMLIEKTDLEEETVDEVIRILKSEFEEEPAAEMEQYTDLKHPPNYFGWIYKPSQKPAA